MNIYTLLFKIRNNFFERCQKFNSFITLKQLGAHGNNCFIGYHIEQRGLNHVKLGNNVRIAGPCRIEAISCHNGDIFSPLISIGNNVNIEPKCHIGATHSIIIEDWCLFGSNVLVTDHAHGDCSDLILPPIKRPLYSKGTVKIEEHCWIGENAVILPGVTIGHHSIVGAGAIVTKSFPPYSLIGGNPAKLIKQVKTQE